MKFLSAYSLNDTMIREILRLCLNNPEPLFITYNKKPFNKVSNSLVYHSRLPDKLYKTFKLIGLYNIISVNMNPGIFKFIALTSNGNRLEYEVKKSNNVNLKQALKLALESFIKETQKGL